MSSSLPSSSPAQQHASQVEGRRQPAMPSSGREPRTAAVIGAAVRAQLADLVTPASTADQAAEAPAPAIETSIPALLIETSSSLLSGVNHHQAWQAALAALYDSAEQPASPSRGDHRPAGALAVHTALQVGAAARAGRPSSLSTPTTRQPREPEPGRSESSQPLQQRSERAPAWRAALCDHGDLAGLPASILHWGRDHVAVAASVAIHAPGQSIAESSFVVWLAPDASAYRALCRWLSWRHEHAERWQAWQRGEPSEPPTTTTTGIIALCADDTVLALLEHSGFDCYPHATQQPWTGPGAERAVALPVLTAIGRGDHQAAQLMHHLHDASGMMHRVAATHARPPALALADLPQWRQQFLAGSEGERQIIRGQQLLARCRFVPAPPQANGLPRLHMPRAQVADADASLRQAVIRGIQRRYGDQPDPAVPQRMNHELAIIARKNFSSYILAVWELTQGRRTCGRGSGASSLVCYALGITNVDPVRYQLVFERFLCDERDDPPDIDIDFPWDERDTVHLAALERYGREHVAMIATHQHLSARGAFREVARVRGHTRQAITAVAQQRDQLRRYGMTAEGHAGGLAETTGNQHNQHPQAPTWQAIASEAEQIQGLTRTWGLHCGGVVITDDPVRDLVPVHPAAKHIAGQPVPTIAWEKDGAEAMGLVKVDLLGNRSLAVVRDTLNDLSSDGTHLDEHRWHPEDDPLTQRLIARGRTIGCFYIESPAMRLLNSKAGHIDFDRLVVHSSIIRPAANQWINEYLKRLHYYLQHGEHQEQWYPHPALRGLLSESFGILSYQEDVMLVARELAGFDTGQQNRLRQSLGRSDTPQRLAELATDFHRGCANNKVSSTVQDLVWGMISSFAGYSFCKAHSASYAMVSFQCAYLKVHHPAYFLARVIAHGGGFYTTTVYVEEARRHGVRIEPPCVMYSHYQTRCAGPGAIRLGMHLLSGLQRATAERIVQARRRWPFRSLRDMLTRTRPSRSDIEYLHQAGAFDTLLADYSPGQRAWLVGQALHQTRWSHDDPDQIQLDFAHHDPSPPAQVLEPTQAHRDAACWNRLGCLPRTHPFALWSLPELNSRRSRCCDIHPRHHRYTLTVLAWVITRKQVVATSSNSQGGGRQSGRPAASTSTQAMAFVTIEDETGIAETVWFPPAYARCGIALESGAPIYLRGRVEVEFGVATLHVSSARSYG